MTSWLIETVGYTLLYINKISTRVLANGQTINKSWMDLMKIIPSQELLNWSYSNNLIIIPMDLSMSRNLSPIRNTVVTILPKMITCLYGHRQVRYSNN